MAELALTIALNKTEQIWQPLPGPQVAAYYSEADEVFYGGAAGGGKTDLLIGLATTQHKKAIIFRREYPQLKDIVIRSQELLDDTDAKFNGQQNIWRNVPGNRTLEFGAVQYERDKNKYKGRPHDLKAFDEVSEFTESQYRFLTGWARTTDPSQRVRIVATGNPPTSAEGEWVIRRWGAWLDDNHPSPAEPGELRWYAMIDDEDTEVYSPDEFEHNGEMIKPSSRTFIPARLSDNPYLDKTDYRATLQSLPEPLRSQLLYGDWKIGIDDDPWQVIPTLWVQAAQERWTNEYIDSLQSIGVDVARGGKDQTVLSLRYGNWFAPLLKYRAKETKDGQSVAGLVLGHYEQGVTVYIDVIGVGTSPYDILRESGEVDIIGVNFASRSGMFDKTAKLKMRNKRAEYYWAMREALDPLSGHDIALPPDTELKADLCSPRWKITTSGIQIESKDELKKRLGRSPDCGDAVVLALAGFSGGRTLKQYGETQVSKWRGGESRGKIGWDIEGEKKKVKDWQVGGQSKWGSTSGKSRWKS